MADIQSIHTDKAPQAIGPYSQAVNGNGLTFVSGQIPLDPASGEIVGDDIETQTRRVMENLCAILEKADRGWNTVLKTTVYLTDLSLFQRFNQVYAEYFSDHKPARACIEVSALPKNVMVEIDMIFAA